MSARLTAGGIAASLELLVPFGISFYTFEAINYTSTSTADDRPEKLAKLPAVHPFLPAPGGRPDRRRRDFLPQVGREAWTGSDSHWASQLFLRGHVQEARPRRPAGIFGDPYSHSPPRSTCRRCGSGLLAFARADLLRFLRATPTWPSGSAHCFGFRLARNFDAPYLASNIAEFWRRWHISLSTWLRDYVFFPLGGSRGGLVQLAATC